MMTMIIRKMLNRKIEMKCNKRKREIEIET